MKQITLSEAKNIKFKRHDDHYERLMNQKEEIKVRYPERELEVDYSKIYCVNNMVYVSAYRWITDSPVWMVIE